MSKESDESWIMLVAQVIAHRNDRQYRRRLSALKKGLNPFTEAEAFPFVLPYADGVNATALVRAVGLLATHKEISQLPEGKRTKLGASLREASQHLTGSTVLDPEKPDNIARRLRFITNLDLEQTVLALNSVLSYVTKANIPLDWFDLTRTLLHWGNGISSGSRHVRESLVVDYYSPPAKTDSKTTQPQSENQN